MLIRRFVRGTAASALFVVRLSQAQRTGPPNNNSSSDGVGRKMVESTAPNDVGVQLLGASERDRSNMQNDWEPTTGDESPWEVQLTNWTLTFAIVGVYRARTR